MPATTALDLPTVRAWARDNGLQVGDRGRLPAAVIDQFLVANPDAGRNGNKRAATRPSTRKPGETPTSKPARRGSSSSVTSPTTERDATTTRQNNLLEQLSDQVRALSQEVASLRTDLATLQRDNAALSDRLQSVENKRGLFNRR